MKKILSLMRQDLTTALRDNIMIYIIIAPLLLAFAFRSFLPQVEGSGLVFAVDRGLEPTVVERIDAYGEVELYDRAGVIARVERLDAVAGVLKESARLTLVFEGNEPRPLIEAYRMMLADVHRADVPAVYESKSLGAGRSMVFDLIAVILIMSSVFLIGVISGFNVVEEKDTQAVKALAVSPLRLPEYVIARGLLAVFLAAIVCLAASYIMVGAATDPVKLMIVMILSAALTTLVSLFTGIFAHNQITAIALLKVVMPLYLMLPLVSVFVSERFQFLFYPFPNYWQFEALKTLYAPSIPGHGFWLSSVLTLITGGVFLVVTAGVFRRRLGLRH